MERESGCFKHELEHAIFILSVLQHFCVCVYTSLNTEIII